MGVVMPYGGPAVLADPETDERTALAPRYRVIMHDDPVTTMDFVVDVLRRVFGKRHGDAHRLMMEVHSTGAAVIEVVAFEVAERHVDRAHGLARTRKFPLTLTIEPAD